MSKRLLLCNAFGTFGYMSAALQWAWLLIISLPLFTDSKVAELILPSEQSAPIEPVVLQGPSQLWVIIGLIISTIIVIVTLFVLFRLPVSVAKTGKKLSSKSASAAIPLVTRHRPISKQEKNKLSLRLIKAFKLILVTLPLVLLLLTYFIETALSFNIVTFIGGFLALGSLLWFILQYLTARLLSLPSDSLV